MKLVLTSTVVRDVTPCSLVEASRSSTEMLVNVCQTTRRHIIEDGAFHINAPRTSNLTKLVLFNNEKVTNTVQIVSLQLECN
jgi:hypothetical protein